MQPWEIILICFCAIIAVALGMWWKHSLLTQLTKTNEDKKTKGDKMRKKRKIEEQENRIKELEDRIKYFELKEQGATIHHGMTTTISYAYNGKIKEICVYNIYRIVDETDRYIIIETYVGCFDDVKFDYAIIDKSDNSYYDKTKLCKHIKGYTKMKQLLENMKKKNQEKRRK